MRRRLLLGLVMLVVLLLGACTKEESAEKEKALISALKKQSVTPAEDFEFEMDERLDGLSLCGYIGQSEIVVIPDEVNGKKVVSITNKAFGEGSGVKAIKIPDSVERISAGFQGNAELQYIVFGSGLKEIGEYSFFGCHALDRVELNEGLEKLEYNAFADMDQLNYLYVPGTVTEIIGPAIHIFNEDFVLAGKAGSKAEEYADLLRYTFEIIK